MSGSPLETAATPNDTTSGAAPVSAAPASAPAAVAVVPQSTPAQTTAVAQGQSLNMTQETLQFVIKVVACCLCGVLSSIVVFFGVLILVLHDGSQTATVVDNLTKLGYAIAVTLIGIIGGHQALSASIARQSGGVSNG